MEYLSPFWVGLYAWAAVLLFVVLALIWLWRSVLRRRSEPGLGWKILSDTALSSMEADHAIHASQNQYADGCPICNRISTYKLVRQPTSQPPSASSGHRTHRTGLQGLSSASQASTPERQARPESED